MSGLVQASVQRMYVQVDGLPHALGVQLLTYSSRALCMYVDTVDTVEYSNCCCTSNVSQSSVVSRCAFGRCLIAACNAKSPPQTSVSHA